jgi:hypothetical protein
MHVIKVLIMNYSAVLSTITVMYFEVQSTSYQYFEVVLNYCKLAEFVAHGFHIPQFECHVPQIQLYLPQICGTLVSCTTNGGVP